MEFEEHDDFPEDAECVGRFILCSRYGQLAGGIYRSSQVESSDLETIAKFLEGLSKVFREVQKEEEPIEAIFGAKINGNVVRLVPESELN